MWLSLRVCVQVSVRPYVGRRALTLALLTLFGTIQISPRFRPSRVWSAHFPLIESLTSYPFPFSFCLPVIGATFFGQLSSPNYLVGRAKVSKWKTGKRAVWVSPSDRLLKDRQGERKRARAVNYARGPPGLAYPSPLGLTVPHSAFQFIPIRLLRLAYPHMILNQADFLQPIFDFIRKRSETRGYFVKRKKSRISPFSGRRSPFPFAISLRAIFLYHLPSDPSVAFCLPDEERDYYLHLWLTATYSHD